MHGGWKIQNPFKIHWVRELMTWNWVSGVQILCHDTSLGATETSDPIDWGMVHLPRLGWCKEGEKFKTHRKSTQWGSSWREICAQEHKFCVMTPLLAHQRHWIQLIGAWPICLGWVDAWKVKNFKSIGNPLSEGAHDVKFVWLLLSLVAIWWLRQHVFIYCLPHSWNATTHGFDSSIAVIKQPSKVFGLRSRTVMSWTNLC